MITREHSRRDLAGPACSSVARLAAAMGLLAGGCVIPYEVSSGELIASGTDGGCLDTEVACGSECADLETHPDHCGTCDNACPGAQACDRGECRDGCREGRENCDRLCVDLDSDPLHCGGCDVACPGAVECLNGTCEPVCDPPCEPVTELCTDGGCGCRPDFISCSGSCVDPATNAQHCGGCDRDCGSDACGSESCVPPACDGFPDVCGSSCTDVSTDPLHCGGCDEPCAAEQDCVDGSCEDRTTG